MLTKKAKSSLQFSVQEEKKNRETGPTLIAKFVITLPAWRYRACSAQRETMSMIDHYVVYGSQEWRRERERERTSKKPNDGNAPQAQTSQSEKTHTKQKKKKIFCIVALIYFAWCGEVEVGSGEDMSEQSDIVSAPLTEGTAIFPGHQSNLNMKWQTKDMNEMM